MRESRTVRGMRPYLVINLLLVVMLLVGLKLGGTIWETSIRLPGLLIWLVLINGILVVRAGWMRHHHRPRGHDGRRPSDTLRRQLAAHHRPDVASVADMLRAVAASLDDAGGLVVLFDVHGQGHELARTGMVPTALSKIRWIVRDRRLVACHAGGLGEEDLGIWPAVIATIPFRSATVRQAFHVVPVRALGRHEGLWLRWRVTTGQTAGAAPCPGAAPTMVEFMAETPKGLCTQEAALALEGALALHLLETTLSAGTPVDPRTGLLKAEVLIDHVEREIERSERYHQPLCVMLVRAEATPLPSDHAARERVQNATVAALRESLRRLDLMAATSIPDTTAALLTEADAEVARLIAQRLQAAFTRHHDGPAGAGAKPARLLVGYVCCPTDATLAPALLEKANEALQEAAAHAEQGGVVAWHHEVGNAP